MADDTYIQALKTRVARLRERIEAACAAAGRKSEEIAVVAATKCVAPEAIAALPSLGIYTVGENRVQEFTAKYPIAPALRWHIIGALQTNKVKYVVGKAVMIQSVDRRSLAEQIDSLSGRRGVVTDVLVEVNIGGEACKSGVNPQDVRTLCEAIAAMPAVRLRGLMSVPPRGADDGVYERLRTVFERVRDSYAGADILSVGMSEDLEIAIRHGSTMIRPGRALFGERPAAETTRRV